MCTTAAQVTQMNERPMVTMSNRSSCSPFKGQALQSSSQFLSMEMQIQLCLISQSFILSIPILSARNYLYTAKQYRTPPKANAVQIPRVQDNCLKMLRSQMQKLEALLIISAFLSIPSSLEGPYYVLEHCGSKGGSVTGKRERPR